VIISIGIDIIEVRRVRETIDRTPRFAERVFTEAERAYCESRGVVAAQHYAARFAAKEAALKALQTGWSGGISWQDVEVTAKESGAPVILFHGRARELYEQTGATTAHLSIAHTTEHAVAEVVLEKD
jgi:holo-[acyl-carrier protein] synthase